MKCSCLLYVLASGFASLDGLPGGFRKQAPPWNTGGNRRTSGKHENMGGTRGDLWCLVVRITGNTRVTGHG